MKVCSSRMVFTRLLHESLADGKTKTATWVEAVDLEETLEDQFVVARVDALAFVFHIDLYIAVLTVIHQSPAHSDAAALV